MIKFSIDAASYESENESNVIAIHCKGGKGRTGTMVCAVLIKMGLFKDADMSLQYFGDTRTDTRYSHQCIFCLIFYMRWTGCQISWCPLPSLQIVDYHQSKASIKKNALLTIPDQHKGWENFPRRWDCQPEAIRRVLRSLVQATDPTELKEPFDVAQRNLWS